MAGSAGSIYVDLLLRDSGYVQGFNKARKTTSQFSSQTKADLAKTKGAFDSILPSVSGINSAIGSLAGVVAGAFSVQKIVAYSDTFKGLQSRLQLVTGSAEEAARVQAQLFDISQNTSQPFEQIVAGYTRLSASLTDAQKKQYDLVRINELLSKTLVISGADATAAATFFQQFGQAASSDFKAIGQELQTFADQNPAFYKILNEEASKYGKSLKQLAQDGELSFDFIAQATLRAGAQIDAQASSIGGTIGKAFTDLNSALLLYIGTSPDVISVTNGISEAIGFLTEKIISASESSFNFTTAIGGLVGVYYELDLAIAKASLGVEKFFSFGGNNQGANKAENEVRRIQGMIDGLGTAIDEANNPIVVRPKSFKNSDTSKIPLGSGGGVDKKALAAAKKEQSELNTLYEKNREIILGVDKNTIKYSDTIGELNRLMEAGKISQLEYSDALIRAQEEFDKTSEKVNSFGIDTEQFGKRAAENIQDAFADFLFDPFEKGLDGMLLGFVNTVRKMIAEAQAAQLAKALFGESAGGEGAGFLGKLFGSAFGGAAGSQVGAAGTYGGMQVATPYFADGGYLGPGQFGIAGEAGAELLYGGKTGVSIFNQDQMGRGGNIYNMDNRGADQGAVARIEQALISLAGPGKIEARVRNAQKRGEL